MKILITYLFLFSTLNFSQTYLDVFYNNSDPTNSTDLSLLQKITFSGTDITFLLTDATSVTKALSNINKITFSGTNGGNPLPVELVSFTAVVNGNKVTLEWSTATEVNNYGFDVERSAINTKSQEWVKIGFVNGSGNSNSPKHYSFTNIPNGETKFNYRLKQIDNDGKYEYSNVVSIDINAPNKFALNQNYPNPFNPSTKISYRLPIDGFVTLKVYDILGKEINTLVNGNEKAGNYEVDFDGSGLASGVYICRMSYSDYSGVIKMLIMK